MGLKLAGNRLCLKGGFLNRTNYIAAMRTASVEFSDSWYARRPMALADWTRTNAGEASNTAAIEFPTPTADAAALPTHVGFYTAMTSGTLLATQPFTGSPGRPARLASFGFDAGALELYLISGAVTGRGLRRTYESGLVSGTTYVGIFERQPSQNNPGPIDTREAIAEAAWVENPAAQHFVRNSANIEFGIQTNDAPRPGWVGLFDAVVAGNLLWEDQIDVLPEDPDPNANISILANALSVGFTIDT